MVGNSPNEGGRQLSISDRTPYNRACPLRTSPRPVARDDETAAPNIQPYQRLILLGPAPGAGVCASEHPKTPLCRTDQHPDFDLPCPMTRACAREAAFGEHSSLAVPNPATVEHSHSNRSKKTNNFNGLVEERKA
jgi:hypothetical protein